MALLGVALKQPVLRLVPVGTVDATWVPAMWGVHVPVCVGMDGRCVLILLFIFLLLLLLLFKVLISLVVWAGPPAAGQGVAGLVRWHQAVLLQGGVGVLPWLLVLTPHPQGGLLGLVLDDIRTVKGVQKGKKK